VTSGEPAAAADDGIGLLEVVIALLLFAGLALSILPLAVHAARMSAANRESVAATSFASGQLAEIRSRFPDTSANSCAALRDTAGTDVADTAPSGLVADLSVDACPTTYPAAVAVSVVVRDPKAAEPSASVTTIATRIVVTAP